MLAYYFRTSSFYPLNAFLNSEKVKLRAWLTNNSVSLLLALKMIKQNSNSDIITNKDIYA